MSKSQSLSAILREIMVAEHLTVRDMAKKLKCSIGNMSDYINDKGAEPRYSFFVQLFNVFNVDPSRVFKVAVKDSAKRDILELEERLAAARGRADLLQKIIDGKEEKEKLLEQIKQPASDKVVLDKLKEAEAILTKKIETVGSTMNAVVLELGDDAQRHEQMLKDQADMIREIKTELKERERV